MNVPFTDLQSEYQLLQKGLEAAVFRALHSGDYLWGDETRRFEADFAAYCGVKHAVGVASGTDALTLTLKAFDIGAGDEVITVAHGDAATAIAITLSGATPVFVDVDPVSYTMDPYLLETAVTEKTRAIVPVHLYGNPADMEPITTLAKQKKLVVIEDCMQAHGAKHKGKRVGGLADAGVFSFQPHANLGAVGDGGAVTTNDPNLTAKLRQLRNFGRDEDGICQIIGQSSCLDALQAAVLRVKLQELDVGNATRQLAAKEYYGKQLTRLPVTRPLVFPENEHVYQFYVIQTANRDQLQAYLAKKGIETAVHYPVPIHLQPAWQRLGYQKGSLPVTERLAERILSLPLYPTIPEDHLQSTGTEIQKFMQKQ